MNTSAMCLARIVWIRLLSACLLCMAVARCTLAQEPQTRKVVWEYCLLASVGTTEVKEVEGQPKQVRGNVRLYYADATRGCRIEPIILEQFHDAHNGFEFGDVRQAVIAKALAQLGAQGWELIGLGPPNEDRSTPVL